MINPKTISEKMMYSTIRLEASNGSTGTGFFFEFRTEDNKHIPVIITNKHVVDGKREAQVRFFLHTKENGNLAAENLNTSLYTEWYSHPSQDLCFCFVGPLFEIIKEKKKKDIFYIPITEDLVWDNNKLEDLSAIEDIVMVGYPKGLWDKENNLPLFRRGITSSHPAIDFNDKNIGVVDMACFPGSSGSPIFILNENGYKDKKGNFFMGASRTILLGILFRGPQFDARGELVVEDIPTQQKVSAITPVMINLGYYIKALEILEFLKIIKKKIKQNIQNPS